jgi:diacylglycerol O-acyltransferase / wax synthase
VALNITVQSYLGQLCFGLIACRRAVPDVKELATHLHGAMAALRVMPLPAATAAADVAAPLVVEKVTRPVAAKPERRAPKPSRPARKPSLKIVTAAPARTRSRRAPA